MSSGLGLTAPVAVTVEVRTAQRRVFRLATQIGEEALVFARPVPFEPGQRVNLSLALPDQETPLTLRGRLALTGDAAEQGGERGAMSILLADPSSEARRALSTYVTSRLGLPAHP
jgi:uncharacterized protein YndB with AHSA1/START domain